MKRLTNLFVFAVTLAAVLTVNAAGPSAATAAGPSAATVPAASKKNNLTEVLIQGKTIAVTRADFDAEMQRIPEERRVEFRTSRERIEKLLEHAFLTRAFADLAKKDGLEKDSEVAAYLQYVIDRELAMLYSQKLASKIQVPDMQARARDLYEAKKASFTEKEQIAVSHILITSKGRTKEEAVKLIGEIRQRALAGEDFEKLATQYSEDQSARKNKGFLGYSTADRFVPAFAKAVAAMSTPGQISDVVETVFGWHIIRYHAKKPPTVHPYEEVKESLLKTAAAEYRQARMGVKSDEIMKAQDPTPHNAEVEKLVVKTNLDEVAKEALEKWKGENDAAHRAASQNKSVTPQ